MDEDNKYGNDFCTELHESTEDVHDESDKLINMKLVAALTDTKVWSQAVGDFYHVFRQLEISLEQLKDDERLGLLHFCSEPEYRRTELFQKDLEFYMGSDWSSELKPSAAAEKYCQRLQEITETNPKLLVAYVHSMYLALLAGGASLKRIIKKTLGLTNDEGLAIFTFGSESLNRNELRKKVKDTINSIPFTREEKNEIVREKFKCFAMNNSIANSLSVNFFSYRRILILSCSTVAIAVAVGLAIKYFL